MTLTNNLDALTRRTPTLLAIVGAALMVGLLSSPDAHAATPTTPDLSASSDYCADNTSGEDPLLCAEDTVAQLGSSCQQVDGRTGFGNLSGNIPPGSGRMSGTCGGSGSEYVIQWIPETTGTVCFDTTGTSIDTVVYVQRQCGNPNTEIGCNDDPQTGVLQAQTEAYVQAGQPYYLIVDTYQATQSYQPFVLNARPGSCSAGSPTQQPAHSGQGTCAMPHDISGYGSINLTIPANNSRLSGECGGTGSEYVTRWTAPQSGPICVDSTGSGVDTVLYLRQQCQVSGTELVCNDDPAEGGLAAKTTAYVQAGQTYYVVLDTYEDDGRQNAATLSLTQGACNAQQGAPVQTGQGSGCGTPHPVTGYGSLDIQLPSAPGALSGTCGGNGSEYVLAWEAQQTGQICVTTPDTEVDTVLYVQQTCGNASTEIACNDDPATGGLQAQAQATVQAGQTYYIVADQYSTSGGPVTVNIQSGACTTGGPSGQCETPQPLPNGESTAMRGSTVNASKSTAGTCSSELANDVAHLFRPVTSGTYCASTEGSDFDTVLYVREGSCEASQNELACNDDAIDLQSRVEFQAEQGTDYYLIVDGYGESSGTYNLRVTPGSCEGSTPATACSDVQLSNYRVGSTRYFCTTPAYFTIDSSASVDVLVEVGEQGQAGYMRIPWHLEPGSNNVRLHANPSALNETFRGNVTVTPLCNSGGQQVRGEPLQSNRRLVFGKQACDLFRQRGEEEEQPDEAPVFSTGSEGK
jgi:hypothetical protein